MKKTITKEQLRQLIKEQILNELRPQSTWSEEDSAFLKKEVGKELNKIDRGLMRILKAFENVRRDLETLAEDDEQYQAIEDSLNMVSSAIERHLAKR